MKIVVTLGELSDRLVLGDYCEIAGWDPDRLRGGNWDREETVTLTVEQAERLSLIGSGESEVARLETENQRLRTVVSNETHGLCLTCDELEKDLAAKTTLLRDLAAAAKEAMRFMPSDWPIEALAKKRLSEVLRRVDAEAGKAKKKRDD